MFSMRKIHFQFQCSYDEICVREVVPFVIVLFVSHVALELWRCNSARRKNMWSCWINCCWCEKFILFPSIPTSNICRPCLPPVSLIPRVDTYITASVLMLFASTSIRSTATSTLSASDKELLRDLFRAQMFGLKHSVVANAMGVFKNICGPFALGNSR
jgi:hypothetical protein